MNAHWDLARDLLDHELLDVDGMPCGRVDDIELEDCGDGRLRITALLSGSAARAPRQPAIVRWLMHTLDARAIRRIAWNEVAKIDSAMHLRSPAHALGLDGTERRFARWVARLPGS